MHLGTDLLNDPGTDAAAESRFVAIAISIGLAIAGRHLRLSQKPSLPGQESGHIR
ncbi:hypothetical protein ABTY96_23460 [Streptomyces sp. NPDC096057]|uniref:hypothetical protein n=1 Tax=Streptomyces sp. NPDC096057 TaxID=3155543 RepID=UPI0033308E7B